MSAYGEFAEYYDLLMQDAPYERWMTFLEQAMARYELRPRHIADLGCGTGKLSVQLFQQGYTVTGVDLSEDMLMIAQSKLERPSPKMRFLCQDLRELVLPEPCDLAISFCDSLSYLLEEDGLRATFARVRQNLKPNGCFLFDVHSEYKLREKLGNNVFYEVGDDVTYLWQSRFDAEKSQVEYDITFFAVEDEEDELYRRFQECHVQRAYPVEVLRGMLLDSGFTTVEVYADFAWDVPTESSERLFFVAR
ncbi:class I SAM-dependent DNA methyltransferase [Tumebacillus permanentifrigoris]|uniref:Methyltransferase family protein n=1 Tax=Tumebacillus permanentifrigoris TaxID=378543 RepID=A0A316DCS7_9BACL|nr:class I SAM-dependent methyltransferase [Tumebacillus permanentifrigoris]PWK16021.1 methyltransferase family protein [Tumebacillus permanentifrigoris]